MIRVSDVVWFLLPAACAVQGIEPTPFRGPAPGSILVAPVFNQSGRPGVADAFVVGLSRQLEDRGYYVFPVDTGLRHFDGVEPTAESLVRIGREDAVDAVLVVTVRSWYTVFDRVLQNLAYDVHYSLLSTYDGQVIWEHDAAGGYQRELEPVDMGGRYRGPSFEPGAASGEGLRFTDDAGVAAALSRTVFQHLPVASGDR